MEGNINSIIKIQVQNSIKSEVILEMTEAIRFRNWICRMHTEMRKTKTDLTNYSGLLRGKQRRWRYEINTSLLLMSMNFNKHFSMSI